jgi:LAGLIDADG endonuclease
LFRQDKQSAGNIKSSTIIRQYRQRVRYDLFYSSLYLGRSFNSIYYLFTNRYHSHASLNNTRPFRFKLFKQISGKNIPDHWLQWFVGLFEGDGSLIARSKGFTFTITSIHKQTLLQIQQVLGFGNIHRVSDSKWVFRVETRYDIYLLLLLLNGNLVLNKRYNEFLDVVAAFNATLFKGKIYPHTITPILGTLLPSLFDAWISGFTDAEGHFGLPIELGRRFISHYISIRFEIGQNGERSLFVHLKEIFGGGILSPRLPGKHNRIIFKGSKLGSSPVTLVFDYFDRFPLVTKAEIYAEWRSIHKSLLAKEHLDESKLPELLKRCKFVNNSINKLMKNKL